MNQKVKALFEESEDIEILRFCELNIPVRMLELEGSPIHVDTPEDLERAQIIAKDYKEYEKFLSSEQSVVKKIKNKIIKMLSL